MSKHTPEPWELLDAEADKEYLRIRGTVLGGRYKIANVLWPNYSESARDREAAETLANAERIIDCVNACAGMADPAAEIAELKRQLDELLGLVKAVSYHSIPATVDGIKCAAFPLAEYESMVIKAKGSAS